MKYACGTDIGRLREKNEDSALIIENSEGDIFMMVFDGMGGHNLGDIASLQAQTYLAKCFKQKRSFSNLLDMRFWLKKSIRRTNEFLNAYAEKEISSKGMGATFACYLIHRDKVVTGYIGDTRAYSVRGSRIVQHSKDETYVAFLYQSGKITKEEMVRHPSRHVVTNALGCYPSVIINVASVHFTDGCLLLCSDGLYNMVPEAEIAGIIAKNREDVEASVKELIDAANNGGGTDNIAVALLWKEGNASW